ncbi:MAG: META domain-containing protein [Pyrinomonadaceae bacterium]
MKNLIILIAIMSAFAATTAAQAGQVGVRPWKLIRLNGASVANSSVAYIELNAEQTRFTGNAGCNRMFGRVMVRQNRLAFSNIGTTKMACAERRAQRLESDFVRALGDVDRFERRGNSLDLYIRRRLVMKFSASTKPNGEDPSSPVVLEGKKWTLEAIKGVPVSKTDGIAFLVFDKDRASAGGNSTCNVFGGSYSTTGNTLRMTEIISTMRACIEDDRMQVEREFLSGLEKTNRYEIQRGKLLLYQNKQLLLTFNGEAKES